METKLKVLKPDQAVSMGYSRDRRKRRREYRRNARHLYREGVMMEVVQWHLWQAKNLK